jgi:hypothetical protein
VFLQTSGISAGNISMTDLKASASIATPAPAIWIDDVLAQAWIAFVAHWAIYSGIAMAAYAVTLAVSVPHILAVTSNYVILISYYWEPFLNILPDSAILSLADAVIFVSVSQELGGRPFSLGQALGMALRQSPALIAVALLETIFSILAGLFLIVPILVVQSVYAVAVPACVVERRGPIKPLSRSAFLTKNNRRRIVDFTIALALRVWLPVRIIAYLGGRTGHPIIATAVLLPVAGIAHGFGAVAVAVLYAQLRLAREGAGIEHIVQVFD